MKLKITRTYNNISEDWVNWYLKERVNLSDEMISKIKNKEPFKITFNWGGGLPHSVEFTNEEFEIVDCK